ncbi:hypothetical protein ACVW1A_000670 [Bradyrhizobium sp. LB1.3]
MLFHLWRLAILAALPDLSDRHVNDAELKSLALSGDVAFWGHLSTRSRQAGSFSELFFLSALRKKAKLPSIESVQPKLRLALIGGYNLYPLHELVAHLLAVRGVECEQFLGEYDNFVSEILDSSSPLYAFKPDIAFILPNASHCRFSGSLLDAVEHQREAAVNAAKHLLNLAQTFIERSDAAVILANLPLPGELDLGSFRFTHAWRRLEFPQSGKPRTRAPGLSGGANLRRRVPLGTPRDLSRGGCASVV